MAVQVDFGMGGDNPLDIVKFFDDYDQDTTFSGAERFDNSMRPAHFQASGHWPPAPLRLLA